MLAGMAEVSLEEMMQEPATACTQRERYLALLLGVYTQHLKNACQLWDSGNAGDTFQGIAAGANHASCACRD